MAWLKGMFGRLMACISTDGLYQYRERTFTKLYQYRERTFTKLQQTEAASHLPTQVGTLQSAHPQTHPYAHAPKRTPKPEAHLSIAVILCTVRYLALSSSVAQYSRRGSCAVYIKKTKLHTNDRQQAVTICSLFAFRKGKHAAQQLITNDGDNRWW
jgi:hypothetical protein